MNPSLPADIPGHASRERLLYLDGWRGISILLVLIGHFFPVPGINLGHLGVEFFFVLSGRLMAEILFIEHYPLKKFFKRRFSRVYPALFGYIVITMVALSNTFIAFKWKAALTGLTFTYNYAALFKRAGALDHIWSLCIEEHSYIILALIAFAAVKWGWSPLKLIGFMGIFALIDGLLSYELTRQYELTYWRTDVHIESILISAFICLGKQDSSCPSFLRLPFVSVGAVLIGALAFMDSVPLPLHYIIGTTCLAIAINFLDTASSKVKMALSCLPITFLGVWSFSLYLWQQPFYKYVYFKEAPPLLMLSGAFLAALASFYLIERPARSWLNKTNFLSRKSQMLAASS